MKVAILLPPRRPDGRLDQEDTFWQADEVTACLKTLGHEPLWTEYADHGPQTSANLERAAADVVFNLVEEVPEGADQVHRATALLDRLGVRYTGARTAALEALGDKRTMKAHLRAAGLPTTVILDEAPPQSRFIVKSATEHASLGLDSSNVVDGAGTARSVIARRKEEFGGEWFAETFVEGREFDVSLLETPQGIRVLPVAEIRFDQRQPGEPLLFDYASKWQVGSERSLHTNRIFPSREEPLFAELERLTLAAWNCFGLHGFAHVDFRVGADGQPIILEVNANPCLGREAGICEAAGHAGMTQVDIVAALLAAA